MKILPVFVMFIYLSFFSSSASAQDTLQRKAREYHFTLTNIAPATVGFKFKKQMRGERYIKLGLIDLSGARSTNISPSSGSAYITFGLSGGVLGGIEFRRALSERFTFYHGPNLSFTYGANILTIKDPAFTDRYIEGNFAAGVPYSLGFFYSINDHLLLSAELNPGVTLHYTSPLRGDAYMVTTLLDLGTRNGIVSLAYRLK